MVAKNKTDHELNLHHFRFSDGLPQFSYRFTIRKYHLEHHHSKQQPRCITLSLLAQAFSGRVFCAERRAYDS